jgi:hypothetical protein
MYNRHRSILGGAQMTPPPMAIRLTHAIGIIGRLILCDRQPDGCRAGLEWDLHPDALPDHILGSAPGTATLLHQVS